MANAAPFRSSEAVSRQKYLSVVWLNEASPSAVTKGILALLTSGIVVAAVLVSSPMAMSKFGVVAIALVTLGTASAGSPVSSMGTHFIWRPITPPALLIRSVAA